MANTDSNIDISLPSHDELRSAAESGVLGAQLGLAESAAPSAEWLATRRNKSLAWGEQYRSVVLHCYHSYLAVSDANPLEQLLSAQDA